MSRIDLKDIAVRESEQVEWKEDVADPDDVVATLCAFANNISNLGGGRVVCGAREDKDEHGFPILVRKGLSAARLKEVEGIVLTRCRERVSPPLVPLVDEVPSDLPERRILVFTAPSSTEAHSFRRGNEGGKYFVRISRETREARNGILRDLLVRKGGAEPWDRRPCAQATEEDIDLLVLREGLQRLGLHRGGNGGAEAYLSTTLRLNIFVPPLLVREPLTGILRPRNFAILLFGRDVQLFIPGAISFFSAYEGTNRSVRQGQRTELGGTLLSQVGVMLPLLEAQAVTLYDKEDLARPSVLKYPTRALREALVNAFVHRDYERVDPLRVTSFLDRIEINSPGGLPADVSLDALRSGEVNAQWRNQTLAWFFNRLGLAEAEGQGIETIHETMHAAGCPPPEFQADGSKVICILRAHPRASARNEAPKGFEMARIGGRAPIFLVPFPRNPYFTGREDMLQALAEKLSPGGRASIGQMAAISGLGGIGKTQTAVEFAYRHRHNYAAVFFVRAETEMELLGGFADIASKLELPEAAGSDQRAAAQATRRWLEANEGWLLILDNADSPELLQSFLPSQARGDVLITSRGRNFVDIGADMQRLAPLPQTEALLFLLERTGRRNASQAERQAAAELATELGELPLALEQAAAYLVSREASFTDYLAVYRRRGIEMLGQISPEVGTRHDPVAITWALNFRQLEQESRASSDLLKAASFLAPAAIPDELFLEGGSEISEAIAAAVKNGDQLAVNELTAPLLRFSLVERDAENRSISLHRLVQEAVKQNMGDGSGEIVERVVKALRRVFPEPEFRSWPRCERLLPHLLAIATVAQESDDLAWLLGAGASYLQNRARFAEAEPLLVRSLAIREKSLGDDHPLVAESLYNLANLYVDQGRFWADVEPLLERALAILEKSLGGDHPLVAQALNNLAALFADQGRLSEAEPLYERSLAIWEKSLGGDDPDVAQELNNLALLYARQGRFSEAEALYERSLVIREKLRGGDHPDVAQTLNNLAALYADQGRLSEAEPLYERSLAIWEKSLGDDHPDVAQALNNLALLYADQGRLSEAEPLYERSLAIRKKSLGGDHPEVARSLDNLAILRRKQGREVEAKVLAASAREVQARHEARNRRPLGG